MANEKATISREELFSPNVGFILGNKIAQMPVPENVDELLYEVPEEYKKRNKNEKKSVKPRPFRLTETADRLLSEAVEKLGLLHQTDFVEAAILSASIKLGLSARENKLNT